MSKKSYIDKLALILIRNRKQLVARSKNRIVFYTPGGKREEGESDIEALARECKEELSIDINPSGVAKYGVFEAQAYGKPKGTNVRLTCYKVNDTDEGYDGTLKANSEIEELRWITSDCPHDLLTVTGIMLLKDLKSKELID